MKNANDLRKEDTTKECNCRLTDHYSNVRMSSENNAETSDNQLRYRDSNSSNKTIKKECLVYYGR